MIIVIKIIIILIMIIVIKTIIIVIIIMKVTLLLLSILLSKSIVHLNVCNLFNMLSCPGVWVIMKALAGSDTVRNMQTFN